MRRAPFCCTLLVGIVSLPLAYSTAFSQPKQFRPDKISGGAATSHAAIRIKNTSGLHGTSNQPVGVSFVPGVGFLAYNYDDNITETGFMETPPDPCGAAGPDRVLAVVNVGIECRDKAGTSIFRDSLHDFFAPLGIQTLGTLAFDPKVVYDHYADRFVVVALERWSTSLGDPSNESRILVAVSRTPAPATATGADWFFMAIDSKLNIGGTDYWADYPGFEVDEEAVYVTTNMYPFSGGTNVSRLWIIDKGLLSGGFYSGGPPLWSVYNPIPNGFFDTTLMPALVFGNGGVGPGIGTFLVGYNSLTTGGPGGHEFAQVIRVDNPLGAVTFTGEFVDVGDLEDVGGIYGLPPIPDAPQNAGPVGIATNDSRALDAVWRNNSLWFTVTIVPNVGYDPVNAGQATAHWFRFDTSAIPGPITVADQGDIGGEDIAQGTFTFFPSVAVNGNGDAKFGFAASAPTIYCGAYMAGREAGDPPGTVQAAGPVQAGQDYYVRTFGTGVNRWGDYSGASVDPSDDSTFWIFNEFADARGTGTPPEDGRWGTAWRSCMVQGPPVLYDFGDLPDPPYPTLLANNGPRHVIVPGVYLGDLIDAEPDGQTFGGNAQGDDNNGLSDEDGIVGKTTLVPGVTEHWSIRASQNGWLDMWIDYNQNGSLLDPGELVYSGPVTASDNLITFVVPVNALTSFTGIRLRYNLNGPLPPTGPAPNGEVEDYESEVFYTDWGDAPAPYPTTAANNGARALIDPGFYMGSKIDHEIDGQPEAHALGDDLNGVDDEDGVTFTTPLDPTHPATVNILVSMAGAIDAWIDFNHDGTWSASEKILDAAPASPGLNSYNFNVPGTSEDAFTTFARFRYSPLGHLGPTSTFFENIGEVEDYEVQILKDAVTGVKNGATPTRFSLFEPVPNPFNPSTTLSFALPTASHVQLAIYDVRGQLVKKLLDEKVSPGVHSLTWDGRDHTGQPVASGIYMCRIQAGSFTDTKRMVLIK